MSKASDVVNVANGILLWGSLIGMVVGGIVFYDDIRNAVATVHFHNKDSDQRQQQMIDAFREELKPVKSLAEEGVSNTLPNRIKNLLVMRCAAPQHFTVDLQELLDSTKKRYNDLNNRQYREGRCEEGVYYNAMGVRATP